MARLRLSDTDDWRLSFPDDQDVRGFRVLDAERTDTGRTVDDMIVDTDAECVSHVVFSDGTEYPARDLSIGDGVVYATTEHVSEARRTVDVENYGHVRLTGDAERANDPLAPASLMAGDGTADDDAAYRSHHARRYASTGHSYDAVRPAYILGRTACATYGRRDFAEVEPSLRDDYRRQQGDDRAWDDVKDAVRHAYDRARDAVT